MTARGPVRHIFAELFYRVGTMMWRVVFAAWMVGSPGLASGTDEEWDRIAQLAADAATRFAAGDYAGAAEGYAQASDPFASSPSVAVRREAAHAASERVACLYRLGKAEEAIRAADAAASRYLGSSDMELVTQGERALVRKGLALERLTRESEAIAVYDGVIGRGSRAAYAGMRESLAWALFHKGRLLARSGRGSSAVAAWKEVERRFADSSQADLQDAVARSMIGLADDASTHRRFSEALALYRFTVTRYEGEGEEGVPAQVAHARVGTAAILMFQGLHEDARRSLAEADRALLGAEDQDSRVARLALLVVKGRIFLQEGRTDRAIATWADAAARHGGIGIPDIQEGVAIAHVLRGQALLSVTRYDQAVQAFEASLQCGVSLANVEARRVILKAWCGKAQGLSGLDLHEGCLLAAREAERLARGETDPDLRWEGGNAMLIRARTLIALGRKGEAHSVLNAIIERYGGDADGDVAAVVQRAREWRAAN